MTEKGKAVSNTYLLTGGTGFLGTCLASELIQKDNDKVYVLVRSATEEEATHRLRQMWQHDSRLVSAIGSRVIPVSGDYTKKNLGLSTENRKILPGSVTHIIHAGAQIGFQQDRKELMENNVSGTRHMIAFAKHCNTLERFVHVSTAYVAGTQDGRIMEEPTKATSFSGFYESSKAVAEKLVLSSGLPYSIVRPGMIVGRTADGWVRNFNTIYYVLKLMLLGRMPVLPVSKDSAINIVPVDYVAGATLRIAEKKEAEGKIFHLTCPKENAPTAGQLEEYVRIWAKEQFSLSLTKPVFAPVGALQQAGLIYNKKVSDRKKSFLSNMLTLMPYFFGKQEFDRTNTDQICGAYDIDWHDYFDNLINFAVRKNFMRQSGQTVFEQAMVRRESTRYPIYYYNVAADGVHRISGKNVNKRIERIVDAMWAWGIRKGDRVAITGINSVEYMTIEQAIGLIGAVSVPIYYTSPAAETALILEKSGAKWFFIGDGRIMESVEELPEDVQKVSYSDGERITKKDVIRWRSFIKKTGKAPGRMYVDYDDLATIRYTSGTTGEPKGVMFNHSQLVWMGEVMTNLVSFKDRNASLSYLSFLPLSHVVEGILSSYAPYYMLAKVDYYYLNDFGSLTDALPKVRPTVFFSVPRFYEKLWEQIEQNPYANVWMNTKPGQVKSAIGRLIRTAVLRKAGLDRCDQLIVGSAPMSEELMQRFRELGMEIYNAYGQTEAPLITINRKGDNVIGTIGTALPDTTVTVEKDGELIIEGPQVCLGYYGLPTDTIKDGVLRSGDLGSIADDGHVTLRGRKKDMIVTAYGKNISIPKIEERLKNISGVSEAVLIGENRPYCTALLWMEEENDVAGMIEEMNRKLSHPEQVRKYKVIPTPLSIAKGELTPNLKVKRTVVEEHFATEIEEMYK